MKEIKYEKPIEGNPGGCLCCPSKESCLDKETKLYNGFGGYMVTKDEDEFYSPPQTEVWEENKTVSDLMPEVLKHPSSDFRIILMLPLRDAEWQLQNGKWMLIKQGIGFA